MTAIEFSSPTGTLALFDPQSLKHRLLEPRGWWKDTQQAVREIAAGRFVLVELGLAGTHLVRQVSSEAFVADAEYRPSLAFQLACPSGPLFVGKAESTSGDDMEPDADYGDIVLAVPVGVHRVQLARGGEREVLLAIEASDQPAVNSCEEVPVLGM
jgi:hypothetical protein